MFVVVERVFLSRRTQQPRVTLVRKAQLSHITVRFQSAEEQSSLPHTTNHLGLKIVQVVS